MAKHHKCDECGCKMEDEGCQGYCDSCYGKKWDAGFESTSDHAYKLGFDELVETLDGPWTEESKDAAREIMVEWGPLEWKCEKCGKVRLEKEGASRMKISGSKVEFLCKPCPGCGVDGHVEPVPPDRYFH